MNKRIAIGTVLILGSLLAAACNLPFAGEPTEPEAQVLSTAAPSEQDNKPDSDVISLPTEAAEADIDEARGTPITRLEPDTLILITYIHMITAERGWGIGGLGGNSDHDALVHGVLLRIQFRSNPRTTEPTREYLVLFAA